MNLFEIFKKLKLEGYQKPKIVHLEQIPKLDWEIYPNSIQIFCSRGKIKIELEDGTTKFLTNNMNEQIKEKTFFKIQNEEKNTVILIAQKAA